MTAPDNPRPAVFDNDAAVLAILRQATSTGPQDSRIIVSPTGAPTDER